MIGYIVWLLLIVLVLCFSSVLLFGAPWLPTLRPQIITALDLLDLQPGQTLLELGCGDGRVMIAAAQRGLHVVGYELNPVMALIAWLRTRRHKGRVRMVWGDYWHATWPPADGIFAFILPRYMPRLEQKIVRGVTKPIKVASFAFEIPGKEISKQHKGVFLYMFDHPK